jgi:hypothetical protein
MKIVRFLIFLNSRYLKNQGFENSRLQLVWFQGFFIVSYGFLGFKVSEAPKFKFEVPRFLRIKVLRFLGRFHCFCARFLTIKISGFRTFKPSKNRVLEVSRFQVFDC